MSTKPRQKHLSRVWIRVEKKLSQPSQQTKQVKKPTGQFYFDTSHMFDNLNTKDLKQVHLNRGTAKRFANHVFRQRME